VLTDDLDMGAITQRYGRGQDVKLAITAGNDLALICHRVDTAEIAAKALAELPHWMTEEAHERVEKFRRKLHNPAAWSEGKWQKTCKSLATLASEVPELATQQASSPVADY
jgi:beta-N-acetylhexosaminidase